MAKSASAQSHPDPAPVVAPVHAAARSIRAPFVRFLLTLALFLILVGLFEPALIVTEMGLFESKYSIVKGIRTFFEQGQTALGVLVLTVSVIIPIFKILFCFGVLTAATTGPRVTSLLHNLGIMSPWSLTEVFILAVVILVLNGQLITSARLQPGAWFFAAGVAVSLVAIIALERKLASARR
jgi:paraquat-inducible protein A